MLGLHPSDCKALMPPGSIQGEIRSLTRLILVETFNHRGLRGPVGPGYDRDRGGLARPGAAPPP